MRLPIFVISLVLAACGGGGGGAGGGGGGGSRTASGGACLPITPLRLLALEHGREWEPMSTLAADGTITTHFSKRTPLRFRIEGDRLVGSSGPSMTCGPDGVVRIEGTQMTMRFEADGALVDGGGMRIFVADNGAVDAALSRGASHPMPWRVEGVTPATRRTAEMLVFASLASVNWSFH